MSEAQVDPHTMTKPEQLALVQEHLRFDDDGSTLRGRTPDWFGPVLFGGFVIAQAIAAAVDRAPAATRLHSLHAYFLRPVAGAAAIDFRVDPVRDGRRFASRSVQATQDGKAALTMTASFTADGEAADYDLGGIGEGVPDVDGAEHGDGPPPFEAAWVGPSPVRPDGTMESTHRKWFRVATPMPDDPRLHAALLGFASDWTGTGGRPLRLEGDTTGMVSLDHALWIHRPPRLDEWLFSDFHSLVNAGGRGLLRGAIRDRDGRVVASMAQEMLLS